MLRSMSWTQFKEWMTFERLEPFGPERLEEVVTMITCVLLNQRLAKGQKPLGLHQVKRYFGDMTAPEEVVPKKSSAELFKVVEKIVRTQKLLKYEQKLKRQAFVNRSKQPRIPKVVKIPMKTGKGSRA